MWCTRRDPTIDTRVVTLPSLLQAVMYWQFETAVLLPMMLVLTAVSLGAVAGALHLLRLLPEGKIHRVDPKFVS